jgi:succinyl-diaminopimelate desuccinylase
LASELIAFDTTSPLTSDESLRIVADLLDNVGIDATIHSFEEVKNLTAEFGSDDPTVCFNGHMDVVPPGSGWTETEPFEPLRCNGFLYGRGAADMKGALAAEILAFIDLYRCDGFDGRAVLMIAGEEEVGGDDGTARLAERFPDVDFVIVGEATDLDIQVATRGILWLDVVVEGQAVHASRAHLAPNLIADLPRVLEALTALELDCASDEVLPDPSAEVTIVRSDETQNSTPDEVRIGMDFRYLPTQSPVEIRRQVDRTLAPLGLDYRIEMTDHGGAYKLSDDRFLRVVTTTLEEARGESVCHIGAGGASDGRFFSERGIPFVEIGVEQESVHQANERCSIADLRILRETYCGVAERLSETQS